MRDTLIRSGILRGPRLRTGHPADPTRQLKRNRTVDDYDLI
jgi:hypothetical protein